MMLTGHPPKHDSTFLWRYLSSIGLIFCDISIFLIISPPPYQNKNKIKCAFVHLNLNSVFTAANLSHHLQIKFDSALALCLPDL